MAFFMPRARHGYRRGGPENFFVAMLFAQLLHRIERLPYKPPVTLFLMFVMGAVHWSPELMALAFPGAHSVSDFAFNPYLIVQGGQWHRLWMSAFMHASAMHLYYNMSSFLYKGVALESVLGETFALVVGALTVLSQLIFLGLSWLLAYEGFSPDAWVTNTVGFSGTLFALKVLLNSMEEGPAGLSFSHFFRLDLPWSKIVWVELLIAHFMVPGSSFLGHLSGILAGIVFLPVFSIMIGGGNSFLFFRSRPRFHGGGATGTATRRPPPPPPVQQQEEAPRQPHRRPPPPPPVQQSVPIQRRPPPDPPIAREQSSVSGTHELSVDELRRRRMARFSET